MQAYILRRLIQMVIVIFILSFVCYALMGLMPGDPIDLLLSSNPNITSEDVARLKALHGLDQPIYVRYYNWLTDVLSGNLGYSRTYKVPAADLIGPRLINTFFLSMGAFLLSALLAIPLGIISAIKKGSRLDYIANFLSFAGISVPSFWLAIVLIILFAVKIKLFPAGGTSTIGVGELTGFSFLFDRVKYLFLPTLSLCALQMGTFVRYTRSSMIEVIGQDYIRTAKAKGLSNQRVIWIHEFKNALIPIITVLSINFSTIFSGALITETVFAYQGVGRLLYDSIIANDFNIAMISFMITVAMVLIMNLVADLLYAVVDPRITYS